MPSAWAAFWQSVRRFQSDKVNLWLGFRNALGIALPLAAGAALGQMSAGLAMSTGALNVAFRDSDAPYAQRARQMLMGSLVAGLTVFAGTLGGRSFAITASLATVWAFAAGMLVAVSQAAADVGVMSVVMLVVYSAVPLSPDRAALAGLFALAGGLLQTVLTLAFWPLRRYVPERRALGSLYLELARSAASPPDHAAQSPPATAQSIAAQNTLANLAPDRSVESERYRLLLTQAERMRLSVLALARVRARLGREQPVRSLGSVQETSSGAIQLGSIGAVLLRYFEICSSVLRAIGTSLIEGLPVKVDPDQMEELSALAEQLRAESGQVGTPVFGDSPAIETMLADARFQMDALAGQIRAAVELATSSSPDGTSAFARREAGMPWNLRVAGTLATLRANLTMESAACRHAVRLSICVLLGDALAHRLELRRSYWLPMTIAIVLKPDFTATFSRGVLRLAGTFAGLFLATVMVHVLPPGNVSQIVAITMLMFVVRGIGGANYGILATSITALVVFLVALTGVSSKEVIAARALNTVIGGAIALLAYWVWPTWERTQISEAMARMLDGYRNYIRVLSNSFDAGNADGVDRVRMAARLARTNLEASIDRSNAEPGASKESVQSLHALLASSHRLAHALMALEAGLSTARSAPPREAFRKFAHNVDLTLYFLSAALRGSTIAPDSLPDLREDHRALVHSSGVHSGDSQSQRYAFLNVEADRITNSLNTLSEELLRWIGSKR